MVFDPHFWAIKASINVASVVAVNIHPSCRFCFSAIIFRIFRQSKYLRRWSFQQNEVRVVEVKCRTLRVRWIRVVFHTLVRAIIFSTIISACLLVVRVASRKKLFTYVNLPSGTLSDPIA